MYLSSPAVSLGLVTTAQSEFREIIITLDLSWIPVWIHCVNTILGLRFSHHYLCLLFTLHRAFAWRNNSCYSQIEVHGFDEFNEQHQLRRSSKRCFALYIAGILFYHRSLRHFRERACVCSIRHQQTPQDSDQLLRRLFGSV